MFQSVNKCTVFFVVGGGTKKKNEDSVAFS